MPLTDRQIKGLKPKTRPYKISDGGGLHLLIPTSGSKLWRLAYRFDGKQKLLALGAYPVVGLAEARDQRTIAKRLIASGTDPSTQRRLERIDQRAANSNTLGSIALELIDKNIKENRAAVTVDKKKWLLNQIEANIADRPISQLTAAEILIPLKHIEAAGNYEKAKRLRGFISEVCRYAIATARLQNDPTFGLKGALVTPPVKHMAALTNWHDFGNLINDIWGYPGRIDTRNALKLMALLFPRPIELRKAEWQEIDLTSRVWRIPAEHSKTRKVHIKPLSNEAIQILEDQLQLSGHRRLIFPGMGNPDRPISENTLNLALRRMGYSSEQATSHGFRATASTLLNESGLWQEDAIEAELAHVGKNEVRRAYHRAQYWQERTKMAEWWSNNITQRLL